MNRKFFKISIFTLIWGFLILTISWASNSPVAMISNIKGDVIKFSKIKKRWEPLQLLSVLQKGEKVILKNKSTLRITFYNDTHSEIIKGPCNIKIKNKSCVITKGNHPKSINKVSLSNNLIRIKPINKIFKKRKDYKNITIINPTYTISSLKPDFRWEMVKGADKYIIILKNNRKKTILKKIVKNPFFHRNKTFLKYSSSYTLTVKALQENKVIKKGKGNFSVISKKKYNYIKILKNKAKKDLYRNSEHIGSYVILLNFYLNNNMIDKSLKTCSLILEQRPQSKKIWLIMKELNEIRGIKLR